MKLFPLIAWCLTTSVAISAQPAALPPLSPPIRSTATTRFGPVQFKRTLFRAHQAWRLSDGHSFAVVVPALARVMEYGFVGDKNILWNNSENLSHEQVKNHGGDKTWLAPQSQWPLIAGSRWSSWPPDPSWEQAVYTARLLPGPVLRVDGPVSRASGVALAREYSFTPNGEFVISQIATKKWGPPLYFSLWSVTQVPKPDAVFLPLNPQSPYQGGFYWQSKPRPQAVVDATSTHLQLRPLTASEYKVGADAPIATIVAVCDGVAFRLRAPKPSGSYPDGAAGAGFPVEIYSSGVQKKGEIFCELELLGPVRFTRAGQSWRHTMRWDLQRLTNGDVSSEAHRAEIQALLYETKSGP